MHRTGGSTRGTEIVQVYMSSGVVSGVATPRHNLVGFARAVFADTTVRVVHVEVQVEATRYEPARLPCRS